MDVLSRYLVQRGYEVLTVSTKQSGPTIEETEFGGRRLLLRPLSLPFMSACRLQTMHTFFFPALRALHTIDADVVHSFFFSDAIAASLTQRSRKCLTIFQMNGVGVPGVSCYRWLPPEGWLLRRAINLADERITCSRYVRELVWTHYHRDSHVIPPPVNVDAWPLGQGPSDGRPTILAVANFDVRSKGIRVLVSAFRLVKSRVPDALLRLSGQISEAVQLEVLKGLPDWVRSSIEVLGVGKVGDVSRQYREASLLVLPSLGEPSGTVLVESLASGTPVVATNHGGIPEFVDSAIGILFEPKPIGPEATNAEGLADAILKGLDLSQQIGIRERCRAHASKFSSEIIGPQIERLYASS